ncbi:Choline trimethylamine-lyase activating enzyme [Sporomusa carbonis]|uniref:4Fe-4S single cluster domain-containing protein n=1 Tax=Sporomusa carbonis TaxID=3076075 RepID=UPI003A68E454
MSVEYNQQQGGVVNMAAFLPKSQVNGPGLRAVVWVQGCPRRCEGCFNPDMLEFRKNQLVPVAELAGRILAIEGIEGVTFSGGEPFAQAAALAVLAELLSDHGLTIVVFTGYNYQELACANNPAWQRLLAQADLLIAGPYQIGRPSDRYLCGSDNQQLIFLTDKLKNHPDIKDAGAHFVELTIGRTGNIIITGVG